MPRRDTPHGRGLSGRAHTSGWAGSWLQLVLTYRMFKVLNSQGSPSRLRLQLHPRLWEKPWLLCLAPPFWDCPSLTWGYDRRPTHPPATGRKATKPATLQAAETKVILDLAGETSQPAPGRMAQKPRCGSRIGEPSAGVPEPVLYHGGGSRGEAVLTPLLF